MIVSVTAAFIVSFRSPAHYVFSRLALCLAFVESPPCLLESVLIYIYIPKNHQLRNLKRLPSHKYPLILNICLSLNIFFFNHKYQLILNNCLSLNIFHSKYLPHIPNLRLQVYKCIFYTPRYHLINKCPNEILLFGFKFTA